MGRIEGRAKDASTRLATKYNKDLDLLFPDGTDPEDSILKPLKQVVMKIALDSEKIKWASRDVLGSVKLLFTRLKCLRVLDADL